MNVIERIRTLAKEQGRSLSYLCKRMNVARVYFIDIEKNGREIPIDKLEIIANILNTSVDYLLGNTDETKKEPSNIGSVMTNNIRLLPVYESVSAGFGAMAQDYIIDYIPCYIKSELEAEESFCIKVTGDSMYPKIEEGDIIQIHRQTSVDSGSIAVVLVDGEEGFVKRVEYGNDWIELISINPMYPPMRFEGSDADRVSIVGLVRKIIKDV